MSAAPAPVTYDPQSASPTQADSRQVMQRHARSFSWAAAFLGPQEADDAAVVYHFCRCVDDSVDEAPDPQWAAETIASLRRQLRGQDPAHGVVARFLGVAERRHMDLQAADDLITGCHSDLGQVRVSDDAELIRYAYRVAGTVGCMMCAVLGVTAPTATAHAIDLGIAMQITNICRDVREDALRGRVYLPATRLRAHGADPQTLLRDPDSVREPVRAVTRELLDLAELYYRSARAGYRYLPWRARFAIVVAARIYRAIGTRLRRQGADPLAGRTVVPATHKAVQIVLAAVDFAMPEVVGLGTPAAHDPELHSALWAEQPPVSLQTQPGAASR